MFKIRQVTKKEFESEKIVQAVEAAVTERVVMYLNSDDVVKLAELIEKNDPSLANFLKNKCPDLDNIIEEEINKIKITK